MLSLNIPLWKLFRWFRRLQLWATGDGQLHHDKVLTHASRLVRFFGETSRYPGDLAPLPPRFAPLWLLAFPKIKITFEREEISDHQWDSGKYDIGADGDWQNCVRSWGTCFEGDWGIIVLCTVFLVSCIFFNKCLYFSYDMAGYLVDRPHTIFFSHGLSFILYLLFLHFFHKDNCILEKIYKNFKYALLLLLEGIWGRDQRFTEKNILSIWNLG